MYKVIAISKANFMMLKKQFNDYQEASDFGNDIIKNITGGDLTVRVMHDTFNGLQRLWSYEINP